MVDCLFRHASFDSENTSLAQKARPYTYAAEKLALYLRANALPLLGVALAIGGFLL